MSVYYNEKSKKWKAEVWHHNQRVGIKTFDKKSSAEKYERECKQAIESAAITGSLAKDYTYNEIYDFWYIDALSRKRETSLIKDRQMYKQYISPILSSLNISEISPLHFQKIISDMLKKDLSKASVNKVIQHFKAVFNYALENGLIVRNPAKGVKQLKLDSKEMDYLSQDEMDQFLNFTNQKYVDKDRWKHVFYLTLFLTGARLGEILGLEWSKIYFDRDAILIGQMWSYREQKLINTTKGKKDRLIPLNSLLKQELGVIKNYAKGSFVFSDNVNRPIDPSNFRSRNWEKDLDAAGIRQIRIHDARHTYASLFMMNGGSLYDLKEILGHSSITTTERYTHLSNSHLAGVKDLIMPKIGPMAEVISAGSMLARKNSPRSIHAPEERRA